MVETDEERFEVALHELGHWVVWRMVDGARVRQVRLHRRGGGTCSMDWSRSLRDEEANRLYLVGLLAGGCAQEIHAERMGTRMDESGWSDDMATFRRVRRKHEPSRRWSERELKREAHRLLVRRWDRLEEMAVGLVAREKLTAGALKAARVK